MPACIQSSRPSHRPFPWILVPFLAWGGAPAVLANISLSLEPPAHALSAGSTHTFIPDLSGTQDRSHLGWELLENGRPVGTEDACLVPSEVGRAALFTSDSAVTRTFQVRVTSDLDPEAKAEVTVLVEPRPQAPFPRRTPPQRFLWPLPLWSDDQGRYCCLLVRELQVDQERPDWARMVWEPGFQAVLFSLPNTGWLVRRRLDRRRAELVASTEMPRGMFRERIGGLAVHPHGGYVVADWAHHRIRWIGDGIATTLAGGGAGALLDALGEELPATQVRLGAPTGMAVTAGGEVVFGEQGSLTDPKSYRIRKITSRGTLVPLANHQGPVPGAPPLVSGPGLRCGVRHPLDLALAPDGRIVFVDRYLIRAMDPDGTLHTMAGNGRRGFAEDQEDAQCASMEPKAVVVAPDGSVILCDHDRVRQITPDHHLVTLAGANAGGPSPAGRSLRSRLSCPAQTIAAWWKGIPLPVPANQEMSLESPFGLCLLPGGSLLVLDQPGTGGRIQFLGPGGAGEQALVDLVYRAWDRIWARDQAEVNRILASLDRWAQVPKSSKEKLRLSLGAAVVQRGGLPRLPLDLEALVGGFQAEGEREQGLALQAAVAGACIRHAAATCHLPVTPMKEY